MFDASAETCALELGTCRTTLEGAIRRKFNKTFDEYKTPHLQRTVLRLKQRMITKALAGDNVCLIYTLKHMSDWDDRKLEEFNKESQIQIKIVRDEPNKVT